MALSREVKLRILQANAINESQLDVLTDGDYEELAARHGGMEQFGGSAPAPTPSPTPGQQETRPQYGGVNPLLGWNKFIEQDLDRRRG